MMLYVELAILVTLTLANGLLAMAELAVVSSRRARLQALADRNVSGARHAVLLAADPGKFLSTVQIGITLIGILSGAFSGATLGLRLAGWLISLGFGPGFAEVVGVGLVVAAITYASLIVGELVPKQIALRSPEKIATKIAPAMSVMAKIAHPLVWLLDASGRVVLRLLGQGSQTEERVTEEEIKTLMAEAETAGIIEPEERAMIAGIMRLGDRPVRAVMTPRRKVDMIDLSRNAEKIKEVIRASVHSRLPAFDGSPEEVLGVIQVKDLLDAYMSGEQPEPRQHVRPAPIIPDTADALDIVDVIRNSSAHMALVHDEYGHFEGVVTNADILKSIVGQLAVPQSPIESDIVRREDGSWLISGTLPVDELAERLSIDLPEPRSYHTAAGFVLDWLEHLPRVAESFDALGWRFEVVDLDGRRIDKILITRRQPESPRRSEAANSAA